MHTATEVLSSPIHTKPWFDDDDATAECDFCGRAVRRESALEHTYRRGEGVEFVPVCTECDLGTD